LWRETIPFSFERLYKLVSAAVRIEPEVPCEPYDMSVWPLRRLPGERAEMRYQLHTRNLELLPFIRPLSKKFRTLAFRLMTDCEGDEITGYGVCNGRVRSWLLPEARHEASWERARQQFGLTGDEVYDDDVARAFAEELMREEALDHWDREPGEAQPSGQRARNWWNRPVSRDLETERIIAIAEIAEKRRVHAPAGFIRNI
jgi:hypothetical protein